MTEKHIHLAVIFIVHAQKYVMIAEIVYIYIKKRVFDETSDLGFIKIYTKIKEEKRRLGLEIQRFLIRIDPLLSSAPFGTVAHSDKIYRTSHRNELEISMNGRILSEMLIEY